MKNAYRVLLTRARQGMVIVVPEGDLEDATRKPEYYDRTFEYLKEIGIGII
ncbi:MAG TPA: DNA/RNA helicase domain-containing protein [Hanamia sp.]|nr:DNA/RNA helicase domain-containing protein [Hanamia sp.]